MTTKLYVTVLAVVEVVKPIYERSNDQLLEDVGRLFDDGWPVGCVVDSEGRPRDSRLISGLSFASVEHGVSDAARKQGCDESPVLPPRPSPVLTMSDDEAMVVSDALDFHVVYDLAAERHRSEVSACIEHSERLARAIHDEARRDIFPGDVDIVVAALQAYPNHRDEEAFDDRDTASQLADTLVGRHVERIARPAALVPHNRLMLKRTGPYRCTACGTLGHNARTCARKAVETGLRKHLEEQGATDASTVARKASEKAARGTTPIHPTKTKRRTKRSAQPRP